MSRLLKRLNPEISPYRDRSFVGGQEAFERAIQQSTTVYVGNMSFFTREEQVYEVFSKVGHIDRVIMGLDRLKKTPCGFCFVEYYTRAEAERCVKYMTATVLDERIIRVDHDWGFVEGRQWGRGKSGGQVRDEFRQDYDSQRGGWGKLLLDSELSSPQDHKRRRIGFGGDGYEGSRSAPPRQRRVEDDDENPRFKGRRRDSDDEDDR